MGLTDEEKQWIAERFETVGIRIGRRLDSIWPVVPMTANTLALGEHSEAMAEAQAEISRRQAEISKAQAENAQAIAQLSKNGLLVHESIKSLATVAGSHDAQIKELREITRDVQKRWQAQMNRRMAKRKNAAAVALGKRGARARIKKLSPEQRSEIARKGGLAGGRGRKKSAP